MGDRVSEETMEVHSPVNSVIGKKLWNILRIVFLVMRKGFISKRKLLMDMNLMMKRSKILRKILGNLIFHHHSHSHPPPHRSDVFRFHLQEYEFSCSNSPNPVFFHVAKRKHHYLNFPCINSPPVEEESDAHKDNMDMDMAKAVLVSPTTTTITTSNNNEKLPADLSPEPYCIRFETPTNPELAPGEALSPLLLSPFSVRISNYSSEDENDDPNSRVDDDAEEFIRRFYEQLRVQSRTQLLQNQEEKYARRAC